MPKARKYSKRNYKRGGVKTFSKLTITDANLFPNDRPDNITQTGVNIIKKKDIPIGDINTTNIFPEDSRFDEAREVREMTQEDRAGQQRILQEYMDSYNQPLPLFNSQDNKQDDKKCDGPGCIISGGRKSKRRKGRKTRKSRKSRKH
jgi:hypothetical protein